MLKDGNIPAYLPKGHFRQLAERSLQLGKGFRGGTLLGTKYRCCAVFPQQYIIYITKNDHLTIKDPVIKSRNINGNQPHQVPRKSRQLFAVLIQEADTQRF